MTDSSTGGYLVPEPTTPPTYGDALENFLRGVVMGVTGGDLAHCFPRWQEEPPNLPARAANWAALGVTVDRADIYPVVQHDAGGDGADLLIRHERLEVLTSFYGPAAQDFAAMWRDGLSVAQNREALQGAGMGLVAVDEIHAVPALIKGKWIKGFDVMVQINREVRRLYPVLNLLSAAGEIRTAVVNVEFDTQDETP